MSEKREFQTNLVRVSDDENEWISENKNLRAIWEEGKFEIYIIDGQFKGRKGLTFNKLSNGKWRVNIYNIDSSSSDNKEFSEILHYHGALEYLEKQLNKIKRLYDGRKQNAGYIPKQSILNSITLYNKN